MVGRSEWCAASAMRFEESLNVVMIANHVEIEQSMIGAEDHADGEAVAAFVETSPEGAGASSAVSMRIAEELAHRLD